MIEQQYFGKLIHQVPDDAFSIGFDDSSLRDQRFPALVLATTERVPASGAEWFLAIQDCGGISCNSLSAAILPLEIKPSIRQALTGIVEENFAGQRSLDQFALAPDSERVAVKEQYLAALREIGITCSEELLNKLTQALYPVDATRSNLQALTTTEVDIESLYGTKDLVIYIVGENCD